MTHDRRTTISILTALLLPAMTACGGSSESRDVAAAIPQAGDVEAVDVGTSAPPPTTTPATSEIHMTVTFGPATLGQPACADDACVFPLVRTSSTITGSMTGTTVSGGAGLPGPTGGYVGVGIHRFSGEVEGCGRGTLTWTETITSDDGTAVTGTWAIVPSSGTGDLTEVTGGGTFHGTAATDAGGAAEAVGQLDCAGG